MLHCLIHMTRLFFPNIMIRYMENCSSRCKSTILYVPNEYFQIFTRGAVTKDKGKSPFLEVSNDEGDPNFVTEKIFRRRARRHTSTTKLKHTRHMLRQLTKELLTFTEMRVVKLLAKELIKTDCEL